MVHAGEGGAGVTRRLPPQELNVHVAESQRKLVDAAAREIFAQAAPWEIHAALAALYRLRPGLGVEADVEAHARHMWKFPRDDLYFARVCRLLKLYGIGAQWGDG